MVSHIVVIAGGHEDSRRDDIMENHWGPAIIDRATLFHILADTVLPGPMLTGCLPCHRVL